MGVRFVTPDGGDRHGARTGGVGPHARRSDAHDPFADDAAPFAEPTDDLGDWLRGLVWSLGPVAPGTAMSGSVVRATAATGGHCRLVVDVANHQRAATSIVLRPSPLRSDTGVTWRPVTTASTTALLTGGERRRVRITIDVPGDVPAGTYRGTLGGLALGGTPVPLVVTVTPVDAPALDRDGLET